VSPWSRRRIVSKSSPRSREASDAAGRMSARPSLAPPAAGPVASPASVRRPPAVARGRRPGPSAARALRDPARRHIGVGAAGVVSDPPLSADHSSGARPTGRSRTWREVPAAVPASSRRRTVSERPA
jgi:hypothetical protein